MIAVGGADYFSEALAKARQLRAAGDLPGAWKELRAGLQGGLNYPNVVAAARFLENSSGGSAPPGWRSRKVAVVGSDTTTFLLPVLRALAFRDGWWPEFYEAPFGTWRQEILEPQSSLRAFQPEATLIWRSWHASGLDENDPSPKDAEKLVADELALARSAANGLGVVLWPAYDLPADHDALQAALKGVNERLRAALPPGLVWADSANAQEFAGSTWDDQRLWDAMRQHPSPAGSLALAELWLSLLRARWGRAKKVLVTDLDNVLWGGVVGEDGVEGILVGDDSPEARAHKNYQEFLLQLKQKGVLLAICSKNNETDVLEVFARRSMPLRREDFAGWAVNWMDKAANLRALAASLRLGLDSFVFVDDMPAERARVRQAVPEVEVPEIPADPAHYVKFLRGRRFFETMAVTAEDRLRAESYQTEQKREELRAGAASVEEFLQSLEMVSENGTFSDATLDRVEQLLARTNQWNVTTRRHGRAEISALLAHSGASTRWFRLRDRFGDHGLVGLWILVPRKDFPGEWEVDSWVMSCRVIGRGLEELMFNIMVETARAKGAQRLRGVFIPTAKNALVAGLYPKFGFLPEAPSKAAEQSFTLDLQQVPSRPHLIRGGD